MPTIRELADAYNMHPSELREWLPWAFDPAECDTTTVTEETLYEVRTAFGPTLETWLG